MTSATKTPLEDAVTHFREMLSIVDEDGKPTWHHELIMALCFAHSDVTAVQVLRQFADRVEREMDLGSPKLAPAVYLDEDFEKSG